MLRISTSSLKALSSQYRIPPDFMFAMSRHYLPLGQGSRMVPRKGKDDAVYEFWYFLPIRVQVKCTDKSNGHASSTAGNNQMDPFHYLHLPDEEVDLRGSTIAVFSRHNLDTGTTAAFVVNYMDGRWSRAAEEPQRRIKESLEHYSGSHEVKPACFVHLIYLTSVTRWWTNSLSSVNQQLIAYVSILRL